MKKIFEFFKKRSLAQKIIIGFGGAIVIIGAIGLATSVENTETPVEKVQAEKPVEKVQDEKPVEVKKDEPVVEVILPEYKIELIDDSNIGNCIRKTLHIVVTGDYTKDDLYKIAEKEIKDYTSKNNVNAVTVGFYESSGSIGNGYEMGRVEYVPNGVYGDAVNVKAGDYSTFKMVNLIEDKLDLPKGEELAAGKSDIDKIKSEFEDVMDGSKVDMKLENGTLKVVITEAKDHPFAEADENAITVYTDWTLDNMKDDIKTLDITVKRPKSSVRSKLKMSDMKTSNGRYFDIEDITKGIQ